MPISNEHKCIFVHIPKTGGTSIENVLQMDRISNLYHRRNKIDGVPPQHLPLEEIRKEVGEEKYLNYFKFSFVRNPWDRVISEFFYRKKCNSFPRIKHPDGTVRTREGAELNGTPSSFEEFVQDFFVKAKELEDWDKLRRERFDAHLEPQLSFLGDCNVNHDYEGKVNGNHFPHINFMGHFESLQEDFSMLLKDWLELPEMILPKINPSEHLHYTHYYNGTTKKIIEENYQEDIDVLMYKYGS